MSQTFKVKNGDISISPVSGRPYLVADGIKLRQDVNEFFNIDTQPNGFGAGLDRMIGLIESSSAIYISMVYKQISNGIRSMIRLQNSDLRIPRSNDEVLSKLAYLNVQQDNTDPTKFWFRANVITRDGNALTLSDFV